MSDIKKQSTEKPTHFSATFREISEGMVKKGGLNEAPVSQRPEPPQPQTPAQTSNSKDGQKE